MSELTLTEKLGGRKALAFYAALGCSFTLALLDKAHAEVLGLIDTLFFIYAGANVMAKRQSPIKPELSSALQQNPKPELSSALSQEHTP
tara:strand:+ start:844 stop:1110 length:267 start_codon:yes stop_codon:yes gene_type:complete